MTKPGFRHENVWRKIVTIFCDDHLEAVGADEERHVVVDAEGDDGGAALDELGRDLEPRVAEDAHAPDALPARRLSSPDDDDDK